MNQKLENELYCYNFIYKNVLFLIKYHADSTTSIISANGPYGILMVSPSPKN